MFAPPGACGDQRAQDSCEDPATVERLYHSRHMMCLLWRPQMSLAVLCAATWRALESVS